MNQKERLHFCKICEHQKNDIHQGLICGLTQQKPGFEFRCASFKKDPVQFEKAEIQLNEKIIFTPNNNNNNNNNNRAVSSPNNHNTFWMLVGVAIMIVLLSLKYINFKKKKELLDDYKREQLYDQRREQRYDLRNNQQKATVKKQQKAIYYMASRERVKIKRKKVVRDTNFMIHKRLKLIMHKKYFMSIVPNDELPVLAISRGYSFTYNKVKKDTSKTNTQQWVDLRKELAPKIRYTNYSNYEIYGMKVNEKNFYIPGKRKVYGVAKLIEIDNERYFFHYTFKQSSEDYDMLRKYLNYYIKIK